MMGNHRECLVGNWETVEDDGRANGKNGGSPLSATQQSPRRF